MSTPPIDPADRTVRINLRLHPDEMAMAKDMAARGETSLNTALARLIRAGYDALTHPTAPATLRTAYQPPITRPAPGGLFREPPSAPHEES